MALLLDDDLRCPLPEMYRVRQRLDDRYIPNVRDAVLEQIYRQEIKEKVKPGMRVAVAVGSRGIANIAVAVRAMVDGLRELGARPFILSAMGSHGG